MVGYAITIGLIFGGIVLALPFLGEKVPQMKTFGEGLAKQSTIVGFIVGIGGLLGVVFGIPLMLVSFVAGVLVFVGSGLAIIVGILLLMNLLKTRKEVPQEQLEALNSKLAKFQIPIGLVSVGYGLFMLVARFTLF